MIQWFKKHPELLRKESTALSNDSNYKELYQVRDSIFISHGHIIVRANGTHKYPVLIVYPNNTPYSLPEVYPLKRVLEKEEIDSLAKLSSFILFKEVKPYVHFYYHLRHQNNSGNLCIIEWDNLESGGKFLGITSILKRVRDWYAGHSTGIYPPDSQEVEFSAHFNFINVETSLIYPTEFLDEKIVEGDAYAGLNNIIPKDQTINFDRYLYIGFMLDGVNSSGVIETIQQGPNANLLHEKLKTSADYYKHPEIVNSLIIEKKLLKLCWFHIDSEPNPFQTFDELISIIGNGNRDSGIKRLSDRCVQYIDKDQDEFFIGIRFPNRKKILEFVLFKISKKENPPIIDLNPDNKFLSILNRYEKVELVETEKITENSFHERNSGMANYDVLKKKIVNILGTGALGSEIADCLGKAGVGNLFLFDIQVMKAHNSVRHLAGIDQAGQTKVNAVANILGNHNPFVSVFPVMYNLHWLNANITLADNSVSISSVADDNLEGSINEQMVISNKTCFYVRALRGGKVGRIFRVIPGKDACFQCLNLYRNEGKEFINIPEDISLPNLRTECNNPIRPASAADLKLISSLASRLFIDYLQSAPGETNHWIWSTEKIEGTKIEEPYQVVRQHIPIHPKCYYCNHDKQIKVFIQKKEVAFMQKLVANDPTIETGGVLAGRINENGNIIISRVSGPGPKAIRQRTKFEKDAAFCQKFLDDLYLSSKQKSVYVGEWHSHPSQNNKPSGQDIDSLSGIASQKEYLTIEPVSIILSNTGNLSCTIHPAGKRYYEAELKILP